MVVAESDGSGGPDQLSRLRFAGRWLAFVDSFRYGHHGEGGVKVTVVDLLGRARWRESARRGAGDQLARLHTWGTHPQRLAGQRASWTAQGVAGSADLHGRARRTQD